MTDRPTTPQATDNDALRATIEQWTMGRLDDAHVSALLAAIIADGWIGPNRQRTIEQIQAIAIADWETAYGELREQLADLKRKTRP